MGDGVTVNESISRSDPGWDNQSIDFRVRVSFWLEALLHNTAFLVS